MDNLRDPAILFFVFGVFAGLVRSNLEIPAAIARFLSLYLLMALGLKGGHALAVSGLNLQVAIGLGCAVALACVIPALGYLILRRIVNPFDAAAIAATYGSVSAVTFMTAVQHLDRAQLPYGGYMAAAMALMESPAIIMAVVLANAQRARLRAPDGSDGPEQASRLRSVLHESFTDGAQLLLLGSMGVGLVAGDSGMAALAPFSVDLFKGMLAFFLLDMGLQTARNLPALRGTSPALLAYGLLAPAAHALLALALCRVLEVGPGDGALLMVLAASASYIAVPAVLRHALPEANPALYFGLSLGLTFPLNILVGIPVYVGLAHAVLR